MNVYQLIKERILNLKLPALFAHNYAKEVQQYVDRNGPEWTVTRLKAIKQYALGGPPPLNVRLNKKGYPRGHISFLFRSLKDRSPKVRKRVFNGLLAYTAMCLPKGAPPTLRQQRKFYNAVRERVSVRTGNFDLSIMVRNLPKLNDVDLVNEKGMEHSVLSPVKTAPSADCKKSLTEGVERRSKEARESFRVRKRDAAVKFFSEQRRWLEKPPFIRRTPNGPVWVQFPEDDIPPFIPVKERRMAALLWDSSTMQNIDVAGMEVPALSLYRGQIHWLVRGGVFPIVGRIGISQEPGMKARYFASPNRLLQQVLKPLGKLFFRLLRTIPNDCTFDQSKPINIIQLALRKKKRVYSFDLSNFSDTLPLGIMIRTAKAIQKHVLSEEDQDQAAQYKFLIKLLVLASRGFWADGALNYVKWRTGSPLGVYPGWPLCTLAHHGVMQSLERQLGIPRYTKIGDIIVPNYFILGDDVIVLDDMLAHAYQRAIQVDLGMSISMEKTLISTRVAEFCGKVITADTLYDTFKYKELSNNNFIDMLRNLGEDATEGLSERQLRSIDLLKLLNIEQGGLSSNEWFVNKHFGYGRRVPTVRTDVVDLIRFYDNNRAVLYKRVGWKSIVVGVSKEMTSLKEEILSRLEEILPGVGRLSDPVRQLLRSQRVIGLRRFAPRNLLFRWEQEKPFFVELQDLITRGFNYYAERLDPVAFDAVMERVEDVLSQYSLSVVPSRYEDSLDIIERKFKFDV